MALGSITYTAVTWTTGDIATETKMDNMVANDQAYDSHAAQGLLLNNNVGYFQKDSSGTNRLVANINGSNNLQIGNTDIANVLISAGATSLIKQKAFRRDLTVNEYNEKSVIISGWTYLAGDGANPFRVIPITFGVTFNEAPDFVATYAGSLNGSNPTQVSQGSDGTNIVIASARPTGTTAASVVVRDITGTNIPATHRLIISWMAKGTID